MSETKHTPGPWHFVEENAGLMHDHGYGILFGEPDGWGWEKNLYVSVGCSNNVERKLGVGVAKANARLIAAAPDLLEALKALLAAIGGEESTDLWCKDARAAIAKAEETP